MYLEKRTYVKNWDHMKEEEKHSILIKKGGKEVKEIKSKRISEIVEEMGYWRKANAIHAWFVKNVQNGEDNCKDYYVSKSQLKDLLNICEEVIKASELIKGKIQNGSKYENGVEKPIMEDGMYIKNPTVAQKLLPTQPGFFFGDTNYDEYYIQDINDTIKILKECLKQKGFVDFYYSSSW